MASAVEVLGLVVLVAINTAVAALGTRFLRVRLHTRVGSAIYVATLVPVALFVVTMAYDVVIRLLPDLGSPAAVIGVAVVLPMALGVTVDYVWMPAPGEIDLPDSPEGDRAGRGPRRSRRN